VQRRAAVGAALRVLAGAFLDLFEDCVEVRVRIVNLLPSKERLKDVQLGVDVAESRYEDVPLVIVVESRLVDQLHHGRHARTGLDLACVRQLDGPHSLARVSVGNLVKRRAVRQIPVTALGRDCAVAFYTTCVSA
jgi:hypothetical protein